MTVLFVAAAVWLLVQGDQPAWVILPVAILIALLGLGIMGFSRVPPGDALNI